MANFMKDYSFLSLMVNSFTNTAQKQVSFRPDGKSCGYTCSG